jgi:redox-sensitive bicupin YhaK (pirin superfamily)
MKTILYKNEERGRGDYGWLTTRYSFSFADWYDPSKMGFGVLRVLNDDIIAPNNGFGRHGHKNMEIITIVMKGTVTHSDSMNNMFDVTQGEVQVMSAGTGVMHAESNDSKTEALELFQIWIEPKVYEIEPQYAQKSFNFQEVKNGLMSLVHQAALTINQDASITYGSLDIGKSLIYTLEDKEHGVYLLVIQGEIGVGDITLSTRDALAITETDAIKISAMKDTQFLLIEVPMK